MARSTVSAAQWVSQWATNSKKTQSLAGGRARAVMDRLRPFFLGGMHAGRLFGSEVS